ncbi:MAG: alpha/beta hydrolase [Pirellulales bacterium]
MCQFTTLFLASASVLVLQYEAFAESPKIDILRSRTYVTRDTGPLEADVYMPHGEGPFPGMLVVHGGAWRVGTRAQLAGIAARFAEHGYTAVAISYRLAPASPFPAQLYDTEAAVRWMRTNAKELRLDPNHIGGFGYSAGGHLVALVGALADGQLAEHGAGADSPSTRLQCVLAGGAPCDFRDMALNNAILAYWLGGTRGQRPDNYRDASPTNFVTNDDPPMYFFSGEADVIVPISSPRRMFEALRAAGVATEFYPIKDAGHILALFDQSAIDRSITFADKYLKAGQGSAPAATPALKTAARKQSDSESESRDGQ